MLPKNNRVSADLMAQIFKEGRFVNSTSLNFKFIRTKSPNTPRISFTVPKSVARPAVKRNKLRRIGYSLIRNYLYTLPAGLVGVFVFKKYEDNKEIILNEIKNISNKIN